MAEFAIFYTGKAKGEFLASWGSMPPLPPLKSANGVDLPFIRLCTRMWSRPIGGVHAAACDARELELTLILEVQLYSRTLV